MADDASSVFAPSSVLIGGFLSMLLLAWIAARLLGVRHRSWLSALIAGSSGWVLGALLSLAISRGHLEDLNSVVPLVFCVLATMAVTVALDLLHARTPRLRIASRHGLAPYLGLHGDPETAAAAAAAARAAMEEAGGVFVKLGQLLAGRADLLPVEARIEFGRLHETVAPADSDAVLALVQA